MIVAAAGPSRVRTALRRVDGADGAGERARRERSTRRVHQPPTAYGTVVVDEAHHIAAPVLSRATRFIRALHRVTSSCHILGHIAHRFDIGYN
jgi:superfamily II DNA or RNA helicase